jgi:hypothetical protein
MCVTTKPLSYLHIMFFKVEEPTKEFQNSKSCLTWANGVTNLLEIVLPTFCKHVIVVSLAYSSCILELGAKFSLLDLCIASIVVELDVDA